MQMGKLPSMTDQKSMPEPTKTTDPRALDRATLLKIQNAEAQKMKALAASTERKAPPRKK